MSRPRTKATAEGTRAREWRMRVGMSMQDLSDLTGYAVRAIYAFEKGANGAAGKHSEWSWQRYKMACAAAEHQKKTGRVFSW